MPALKFSVNTRNPPVAHKGATCCLQLTSAGTHFKSTQVVKNLWSQFVSIKNKNKFHIVQIIIFFLNPILKKLLYIQNIDVLLDQATVQLLYRAIVTSTRWMHLD